jgi:hypothetical protein
MVIASLAAARGWSAAEAEQHTEIVAIKTTGDRVQDRSLADIGGKGLFAKENLDAIVYPTSPRKPALLAAPPYAPLRVPAQVLPEIPPPAPRCW